MEPQHPSSDKRRRPGDDPQVAGVTLGLEHGAVKLRSVHGAWAREFRLEEARIIKALGVHVLDIQHVGSTSIAGVPAKPILDILVGVRDFDAAFACIAPLAQIGYRHRGEHGIPRRHYFIKGEPRSHHLHMVECDSHTWRVTLAFRDLLRTHEHLAREYASAKRALAAKYPQDRTSYQESKDKVIERILGSAGYLP